MADLFDRCAKECGFKLHEGYGLAIIYMDDAVNSTIELQSACNALVAWAFRLGDSEKRKDIDLQAYVAAIGKAESPYGWLIQGCQFLLQAHLEGWGTEKMRLAQNNALALAGHCGYDLKTVILKDFKAPLAGKNES